MCGNAQQDIARDTRVQRAVVATRDVYEPVFRAGIFSSQSPAFLALGAESEKFWEPMGPLARSPKLQQQPRRSRRVTGSGFITLAATLSATGSTPVAGLTALLGIDRFMSEARALTNFVGNAVATLLVSYWENQLDLRQARAAIGFARGAEPTPAEALSSAGGMPPGPG